MRSRCRRSTSPTIPAPRPRNCSAAGRRRRRWKRAHRLLRQGLPRRRHRAADQRPDLAGDAALAQPQLGTSEPGAIPRAAVPERHQGRLVRAPRRRHVAGARRPDADRPFQPSGRPRCRYLADADARPRADPARARGNVGDHDGGRRTARTSTRTSGRRRMPRSSRRPPRTRSSSASSSTRRSRRRSAARPARIEAGCCKVRPDYGHDYHFHVRMRCPADSPDCKPQDPVPAGEVCGKDLDHWFTDAMLRPKPPPPPNAPPPSRPSLKMADLPPACRQVLLAP